MTPDPTRQIADMLRTANERRQSVLIRGAGTKLDWGRPAAAPDVVLDMRPLSRVIAHAHGDLTATIEAGAPLADVNAALRAHGQWLPLDPAFADRATIGGLLATNDSGPLRHRHGTPRDLVIGVTIATTDGVLAKAGGQVVKNVAGYDLSRLVTGSFGSLAAIVTATFKLAPIARASKTMRLVIDDRVRDGEAVATAVRTLMASQLEPVAFEIVHAGGNTLLLQFASLPQVVDAQIAQARRLLEPGASSIEILDGAAEETLWRDHARAVWETAGPVLRVSWLPATLSRALADLERIAGASSVLVGRAAVGAGFVRLGSDAAEADHARAIDELRRASAFGNIVLLRGSDTLKQLVDVWGSFGDRAPLLASLKRTLDPNDILNVGRGPL